MSKHFWAVAFEELKDKLEKEEKRLKSFQVRLNIDDMSKFLETFFQPQRVESKLMDLEKAQSSMLKKQTIFNKDQVNILKEADAEKIVGLIKKNEKKGLHDHIALLKKIQRLKENVEFFNSINQLKQNMDSYQEFKAQMLSDDFDDEEREIVEIQLAKQKKIIEESPGINVFDLMKAFFDMTYDNMYHRAWGALPLKSYIDEDKRDSLEFQATM